MENNQKYLETIEFFESNFIPKDAINEIDFNFHLKLLHELVKENEYLNNQLMSYKRLLSIKQAEINELSVNNPYTFDDLKPHMWVWSILCHSWLLIKEIDFERRIIYFYGYVDRFYEDGRYYGKQVVANENNNINF